MMLTSSQDDAALSEGQEPTKSNSFRIISGFWARRVQETPKVLVLLQG